MLPPVIKVVSGSEAYMQKQKPLAVGQADVETLCARLGVDARNVQASVLDDVMFDEAGATHAARRITVTVGKRDLIEGAAPVPREKRKAKGNGRRKVPPAAAAELARKAPPGAVEH